LGRTLFPSLTCGGLFLSLVVLPTSLGKNPFALFLGAADQENTTSLLVNRDTSRYLKISRPEERILGTKD
jgi:hypothetical protein